MSTLFAPGDLPRRHVVGRLQRHHARREVHADRRRHGRRRPVLPGPGQHRHAHRHAVLRRRRGAGQGELPGEQRLRLAERRVRRAGRRDGGHDVRGRLLGAERQLLVQPELLRHRLDQHRRRPDRARRRQRRCTCTAPTASRRRPTTPPTTGSTRCSSRTAGHRGRRPRPAHRPAPGRCSSRATPRRCRTGPTARQIELGVRFSSSRGRHGRRRAVLQGQPEHRQPHGIPVVTVGRPDGDGHVRRNRRRLANPAVRRAGGHRTRCHVHGLVPHHGRPLLADRRRIRRPGGPHPADGGGGRVPVRAGGEAPTTASANNYWVDVVFLES